MIVIIQAKLSFIFPAKAEKEKLRILAGNNFTSVVL
jgi:hypothetical protein